ncbi:ATP-binding protein [Streptomyces sp. MUM 16J]|uniref:ATP-binding protein n=1 Tax=Streptomyces sp. MUM 16J TaxID=2791988 RepID=UPI000582DB87|nr:ATP-binding protein [Streptomyces sp. MUM 16J]
MAATVLVPEDGEEIRELLRRCLERTGDEVLTTGSGAEGVRLLGDRGIDRPWRGARVRAGDSGGLGLAMAKEPVTAHGGRVTVGSGPGGGTRMTLPAARGRDRRVTARFRPRRGVGSYLSGKYPRGYLTLSSRPPYSRRRDTPRGN